ncbi:MAG: DUF805 domain-containing protein [Bacteroidota bacterium]
MEWYLKVLKQFADFNGRARRKEFWMFVLINFGISIVLGIIDSAVFGSQVLGGIYSLGILVPAIAVGVRRLHDIGKSGWMYLVILIPLVGIIWLIVLWAQDGVAGENEFGFNPKEVIAE